MSHFKMFKLPQIAMRCLRIGYGPSSVTTRINSFTSSATIAEAKNFEPDVAERNVTKNINKTSSSSIVAAAFASLHKTDSEDAIETPITDRKIRDAKTINELLGISAEGSGVSRRHAMKVISVLENWSAAGKVKLADFQSDARFLKLCKVLLKNTVTATTARKTNSLSDDVSTIVGVTTADEAAKMISTISLAQMVKVMSALTMNKRRSTQMLRSLSYNISKSTDTLDLKQCADVLYSMAVLNFVDDNLLIKISSDIDISLKTDIKKSAVVGSIITSIGLLKYKNSDLLDTLSNWILNNHSICRPQDIHTLVLTLGTLNFQPANSKKLFEVLEPYLTYKEIIRPSTYLNIVWSLVLLNRATTEQVSLVLSEVFISEIEGNKAPSTSTKLKLLNIDAAANFLFENYEGSRLASDSSIHNVYVARTREKNEMVASVIDSLKNLIQSDNKLRTNINTGSGFFLDAECLLDKKCNPLPLNNSDQPDPNAIKVAVMVYDYHDMCIGEVEPHGVNVLISKLLEAQRYKILAVPYTEFKPKNKLIQRVQYLEAKLKEIVKS